MGMLIERIENVKIRHLDELLNRDTEEWQAAKAFVEGQDAQRGSEFGLIAVVRHDGGGPWTSSYAHCHNVLTDRDTFEKMLVIARKYEGNWLSDYHLREKEPKTVDTSLLAEYMFKDCGEHCKERSHHYVLTCAFAGGFYDPKKLGEEMELLKELQSGN